MKDGRGSEQSKFMSADAGLVDVLKCSKCGALDAGPREICPVCHEAALQHHQVPGEGALISWTMIRRPPAAFRAEGAYAIAVVRLDAGVKVTGRLETPETASDVGARVALAGSKNGVPIFRAP
jgi:uncharacterized OB-fold protein